MALGASGGAGSPVSSTVSNLPSTVDVNSGNKSNSTIRVVIASDQPTVPVSLAGGSVTVSATDLDIRNLSSLQDSVAAVQSGSWSVGATQSGSWSVNAVQSGTWNIANISGTISLPTGASTSALQSTGNSSLSSIDTKLSGTIAISAASLPLPSGASTEATLAAASAKLPATLGQHSMAASLSVALASDQSSIPVTQSGTWTTGRTWSLSTGSDSVNAAQSGTWIVQPGNTANTTAWKVDNSAVTQPISAAALPLPSGASTSALQTSGNTSLSAIAASVAAIDTGTPAALGQTTMSASMPVTIASNQASFPVKLYDSDDVGITSTFGSLNVYVGGGTVSAGLDSEDRNYGTPAGTTLRTASMLGVGSTAVSNSNPVPVSDAGGSLTVDGTVAATQSGTWNITNVSGTVSLPTGASTESTLAATSAKLPATLGQKAMAASMAVVLASDQTSIPVAATQSGTWNVTNISGTVSLPTGAATSAAQTTAQTSLSAIATSVASIDTGTPAALGQTTMAASMPVVLASNQSNLAVNLNDSLGTGISSTFGYLDTYVQGGNINVGTVSALAQSLYSPLVSDKVAISASSGVPTVVSPKFAFANISASSTDSSIVAAVSSKRIRVLSYVVVNGSSATDITFNSKPAGAGSAITSKKSLAGNGGLAPAPGPWGHFQTSSGEGLTATTSSGSTIGVDIVYIEV
jgi:hypothetical protein